MGILSVDMSDVLPETLGDLGDLGDYGGARFGFMFLLRDCSKLSS